MVVKHDNVRPVVYKSEQKDAKGASVRLSLEEVGAALATIIKQGDKTKKVTSELQNFMLAFIGPPENMTDSLKRLGFEFG